METFFTQSDVGKQCKLSGKAKGNIKLNQNKLCISW